MLLAPPPQPLLGAPNVGRSAMASASVAHHHGATGPPRRHMPKHAWRACRLGCLPGGSGPSPRNVRAAGFRARPESRQSNC
eukprot:185987-Alexandrium_andersonii.AAC.1